MQFFSFLGLCLHFTNEIIKYSNLINSELRLKNVKILMIIYTHNTIHFQFKL